MRPALVLFAVILAFTVPAAATASRPPALAVTSVTITADGGSWPTCRVIASVSYTGHPHRSATLNVMPTIVNDASGWTENNMAAVHGTGSAAIVVENDYTPLWGTPVWAWSAQLWYRHTATDRIITSPYVFGGATCPSSGVIATWTP